MGLIAETGNYEIAVADPGYGRLYVHRYDEPTWHKELDGALLGRFLTALTDRALGNESTSRLLPKDITVGIARQLLPLIQHAIIVAAAGQSRYERLYPDKNASPGGPLCAICGSGSGTYPDTEMISGYCVEYGHTPFGTTESWDQALKRYQRERADWERTRRHP